MATGKAVKDEYGAAKRNRTSDLLITNQKPYRFIKLYESKPNYTNH